MTYQELFDYANIYSGNFIIPEESLELGKDKFHIVLRNSIGWYQRYSPLLMTFSLNFSNLNYTFTGFEYPKYNLWQVPLIPDSISDVFPSYSTLYNPLMYRISSNTTVSTLSNQPKIPFIWRYDKPILHIDRAGEIEVKAVYSHPIIDRMVEIISETGTSYRTEVDLPSISPTDIDFLDMMTGMFMVILGRSRGLFQYSDSTVSFQSDQLVSEGSALIEKAQQSIIDNSDFYLAWS